MPRILLAAFVLAVAPAVSVAQPFVYEGFSYPAGQSINGMNGGTGWANEWSTSSPNQFTVFSGSTSDPTGRLLTSGNQIRTSGSGTTHHSMTRTTAVDLRAASSSSLWIGFTIQRIDPFSSPTYGGLVIGNEVGSAANNTGRLFIGDPGGSDLWSLERAGGGVGQFSNHSATNAPNLLVVHIQFQDNGPETVRLYVNRPPGGGTPASADAFLSLDLNPSNGPVTIAEFWSSGSIYQFDELRFGTSYAEVTPVPEPATLLGIAALALFLFYRCR